jgi:3-deoxy-manno-octulosonate cytidylyltransferase (CMP-KDO synthetase)
MNAYKRKGKLFPLMVYNVSMHVVVVIPARIGSTRFPGKVLAPLHGRPLIQHVWERASTSKLAKEIIIATDSESVLDAVHGFGGRAVMTSTDHPSGTDRIAEVVRGLDCDIIVNVQGDEPLIQPEVIDMAARLLMEDANASMGTVATRITDPAQIADPNVVKVVLDAWGYAMYFSRAPIPYNRDQWPTLVNVGSEDVQSNAIGKEGAGAPGPLKHIGIYSYRREVLLKLTELKPTALEETEKLEQLRALEHGMKIKVGITDFESHGVDTPEDLERVSGMFIRPDNRRGNSDA